jgi:beta-lactamase regulating signal transducer with metallopeptidase domain
MIAALLDHLWQSTLFAAAIGLLMPQFRSNSAAVRFWLWFAASVKFLVPLSIFTILGRHLLAPVIPDVPVRIISVLQPVTAPFAANVPVLAAPAAAHLMALDLAVAAWVLGGAAVLALWCLQGVRLRMILRQATDLPVVAVVPVKSTHSLLEPGLVGIWRPVILLPEGIAERLSPKEMDAVMAHELCHLRRRDNLLAAVHLLVEALFWFHPLVWWLGSRLGEEREHACDESVLAAGNPPLVYAEGILKVCRFYIQSPACASGVSGAALETRVGTILRNRPVNDVESAKWALLALVALLSVMLPLLAGGLGSGSVNGLARRVVTVLAAPVQLAPATVMPDAQIVPDKPLLSSRHVRRHMAPMPAPAPRADVSGTPEPATAVVAPPAAPVTALPSVAAIPQASANADVSANAKAPANSDVVVCRRPQPLPGSRFDGPQVCRSVGEWAQLRAQGKDIGADGRSIVDIDGGEKQRTVAARYCRALTTGSTWTSTVGPVCF